MKIVSVQEFQDIKGEPSFLRGPTPKSIQEALTIAGAVKAGGMVVCLEEGWKQFFHRFSFKKEREIYAMKGIRYFHLPMSNFFCPSINELEVAVWKIYENCTTLKSSVYLHCFAGVDRTGMVVAAYRVLVNRWKPEIAWNECIDMGFHKGRYFWWRKRFMEYCESWEREQKFLKEGKS